MRVLFSSHANERLSEHRQSGVTKSDVIKWANRIPGKVNKFRHRCKASSGKHFDIVIDDIDKGRLVVTIIGKK